MKMASCLLWVPKNILLRGTPRQRKQQLRALYAMELATRMGYSHITLEGDAHEVLSTIAKKEHGLTPIFLIYEKIFLLNSCFIGFECIHVSRKGNTVAHLAARREMNNVDEKICMNPFPQGIQALAVIDLS